MTEPKPPAPRSALDWAGPPGRADALLEELQRRTRRRRRRRAGFAATGLAVALLLTLWLPRHRPDASAPRTPTAVVWQPERRELPDGSTAELRPEAEFSTDFAGTLRRVTLIRGQVHFQVARDPSRPFVVVARGVEVRAVGTAFAVEVGTDEVAVLVTEGRVAVNPPAAATESRPVALPVLEAGQRAVLPLTQSPPAAAPLGQVAELTPAEMATHLAWRVPRLEFSGTTLSDALQHFNRHSPRPLRIGDPELARVQVSGVVRADSPETLLQFLAANYHVQARDAGADGFILERRP